LPVPTVSQAPPNEQTINSAGCVAHTHSDVLYKIRYIRIFLVQLISYVYKHLSFDNIVSLCAKSDAGYSNIYFILSVNKSVVIFLPCSVHVHLLIYLFQGMCSLAQV